MPSHGFLRCFVLSALLVLLFGACLPETLGSETAHSLREDIYYAAAGSHGNVDAAEALRSIAKSASLLRGSIPVLIQCLDDDSVTVREAAAIALGSLGPSASAAVPALMKAFNNEETRIKAQVASALGQIGSAAHESVPMLLEALAADPDEKTPDSHRLKLQVAIIQVLGQIKDPRTIPPLIELLYGQKNLWLHVSGSLAKFGEPAIPHLIDSLQTDSAMHQEAAQTLGRMGSIVFPALENVLKSGEPRQTAGAIAALRYSRAYAQVPSPETTPLLIAALESKDPAICAEAAEAMGSEAIEAVPALIELLHDPHPEVQQAAAYSLGIIGPKAKKAVPHLIPLLADPDPMTRAKAVSGLALGPDAKPALPRLIELLEDPHPEVSKASAVALAHIGTAAAPAIPNLISLLDDENRAVAGFARIALGGHGWMFPGIGPAAVEPLREALQNDSAKTRAGAAATLGRLGGMAESAVPELRAALTDADPEVRGTAAWALGQMDAAAEATVPALATLLRDEHPRARENAAEALGRIASPSAVQALVELIEKTLASPLPAADQEQRERASLLREVVRALGRTGIEAKASVPILDRLVKSDERDNVRTEAAGALAKIEPAKSLPVVLAFLKEFSIPLRLEMLQAIRTNYVALPPDLVMLLRDRTVAGHGADRIAAAETLAQLDAERPSAIGFLLTELLSDESATQELAAEALGRLGPRASSAVDFLIPLLESNDLGLRWRAMEALGKIGDPRAIKPLLERMRNGPTRDSVRAAWSMLKIDASAKEPWGMLTEHLRSEYPELRGMVLDAFEDLGLPKAAPALRAATHDTHPRLAYRAAQMLKTLEP